MEYQSGVRPIAQLRKTAIIATLRNCQFFSDLPLSDLQEIAEITIFKSLQKNDHLFREGDPAHGFYVVQTGAINVHRLNSLGKEQVIHIFRPGESFAEVVLATDHGYPAHARAVEPSQVLLVQKSGFRALLKRNPELALRMLGSMSLHLRVLVGQLEDMTLKDVTTRLSNWLLKRCPDPSSEQPVTIQLGITKRVLAAELGTVSETLSRTLAKLREQNLLTVKGKSVTVQNPKNLRTLLQKHLGE